MLVQCTTYPELTLYVGRDTRIDFHEGMAEVTAPTHVKAVREFIKDNPDFQMEEIKDSSSGPKDEDPKDEDPKDEAPKGPTPRINPPKDLV